MIESNPKRYKDLDLNFIAHPVTGDVVQKVGAEAVKRAVRNLIYLRVHEKPFQPQIGCRLRSLLFEPDTPIVRVKLRQSIGDVLTRYEPRIDLLDIKISSLMVENSYNITIVFRIKNVPTPISTVIQLERLR